MRLLLLFHTPSANSSKDEDVFPAGTFTEHTHTPDIHRVVHTDHRCSKPFHEHAGDLILSSSLAGQGERPLVIVDMPIAHNRDHSQEGVRKAFNKRTGQMVFIRHNQNIIRQTYYPVNYLHVTGPFIPLYLYFCTII